MVQSRFAVATATLSALLVASSCEAVESIFVSLPVPADGSKVSEANDQRGYRLDAARHIYEAYPSRVYIGKLPPLMHAIVVVEVVVDEAGQLKEVNVIRAPSHAPEVTAAVREMIKRVSPFPAPRKLGGVAYTETWLMDKSGRFQLDALTEGQR